MRDDGAYQGGHAQSLSSCLRICGLPRKNDQLELQSNGACCGTGIRYFNHSKSGDVDVFGSLLMNQMAFAVGCEGVP